MDPADFMKEHKRLIKVLHDKKTSELKKEEARQRKELDKILKRK